MALVNVVIEIRVPNARNRIAPRKAGTRRADAATADAQACISIRSADKINPAFLDKAESLRCNTERRDSVLALILSIISAVDDSLQTAQVYADVG